MREKLQKFDGLNTLAYEIDDADFHANNAVSSVKFEIRPFIPTNQQIYMYINADKIYDMNVKEKILVKDRRNGKNYKINSAFDDVDSIFSKNKNDDGDFKLNSHRDSYRNFQIKFDKDDIEWEADDSNWNKVFDMINSGTSKIDNIKSR